MDVYYSNDVIVIINRTIIQIFWQGVYLSTLCIDICFWSDWDQEADQVWYGCTYMHAKAPRRKTRAMPNVTRGWTWDRNRVWDRNMINSINQLCKMCSLGPDWIVVFGRYTRPQRICILYARNPSFYYGVKLNNDPSGPYQSNNPY